MEPDFDKNKLNFSQIIFEKKVSRKAAPRILKEVTMGTITTEEILKLITKKN